MRGGQEQRSLRLSQLKRETSLIDGTEVGSYVYQEFGSKNRQGGFGSLNLHNKIVRHYQNSSNPSRCHVGIIDRYLRLIPQEARDQDNFYLIPLLKKPVDPMKPWYTKTPIGRNRLNGMLKEMCLEAGISGKYTNHILRAYGATSMFQAGVPEKLIQQRTGHRSIEALRQYERTSELQLVDISNILSDSDKSGPASLSVSKETTSCVNNATSSSTLNYAGISMPPIVLRGCSFTGCSIAFSAPASNVNNAAVNNDAIVEDVLKEINISDVFDD